MVSEVVPSFYPKAAAAKFLAATALEAEALEELRSGGTGGKEFDPRREAPYGIANAFGGTGGGGLPAFSIAFTTGGIANEPKALEAMKSGPLRWRSLTEPMRRLGHSNEPSGLYLRCMYNCITINW